MIKAWEHFKTITHHKLLVMEGCFKVGLFKQGLLHDFYFDKSGSYTCLKMPTLKQPSRTRNL